MTTDEQLRKHQHRCPCGTDFDCYCPSATSHGAEALDRGWRYACPSCDPEPSISDSPPEVRA